jgi:hypothetical protein
MSHFVRPCVRLWLRKFLRKQEDTQSENRKPFLVTGDSAKKRRHAQGGAIVELARAASLIALEEKRGHPILFPQKAREKINAVSLEDRVPKRAVISFFSSWGPRQHHVRTSLTRHTHQTHKSPRRRKHLILLID